MPLCFCFNYFLLFLFLFNFIFIFIFTFTFIFIFITTIILFFVFVFFFISMFFLIFPFFFQGEETLDLLSEEIDTALRTSQRLIIRLNQYKSDRSKFPCLLALHPVFKCVTKTTFSPGKYQERSKYVRATEDMTGEKVGSSHSVEYKYQIWLFIDCNKSDRNHTVEITEMARILRILPQTVLNDYLEENTAVVAELENLSNIKSFSRSFYAEIIEKSMNSENVFIPGTCKEHSSSVKDSIKGTYVCVCVCVCVCVRVCVTIYIFIFILIMISFDWICLLVSFIVHLFIRLSPLPL